MQWITYYNLAEEHFIMFSVFLPEEVVQKIRKNDTSNRGPSAKYAHVPWRAQKSPQTREARWLVSPLLTYLTDAFRCLKRRRLERLGPYYSPFEHALEANFLEIIYKPLAFLSGKEYSGV